MTTLKDFPSFYHDYEETYEHIVKWKQDFEADLRAKRNTYPLPLDEIRDFIEELLGES